MPDLDKFLPAATEGEAIRRHRREAVMISFDANDRLQGAHVEIWDETAIKLADGRFADAVTCHERIVRPCALADIADLIPDHADLLADLAEKAAVIIYYTRANNEMRAAMERAEADAAANKVTIDEQAAAVEVLRAAHAEEVAQLTAQRQALADQKRGLETELAALRKAVAASVEENDDA